MLSSGSTPTSTGRSRSASSKNIAAQSSPGRPIRHDAIRRTDTIDDTGFLKQGRHSVGVQRQYTGTAGKITNCQLGVSLSVATRTEHLPIDMELYLPRSWTESPARRREGRIPADVKFRTKVELALEMIHRAVTDGVPRGVVLADSFFGDEPRFRNQVRSLGLDYAVAVKSDNRVWRIDEQGRRRGKPCTVKKLALALPSTVTDRSIRCRSTRAG